MNEKNILKIGLNKIKKFLTDERITTHTENLFFLIEDGLHQNKKSEMKFSENISDGFFYALGYEYVKENPKNTFKAIDLIAENYQGLYIDTSYYYLNVCHGNFDKGYLIDMCMKNDITAEIKQIFEEKNENNETIVKEIIIFTKPAVKIRVKNK